MNALLLNTDNGKVLARFNCSTSDNTASGATGATATTTQPVVNDSVEAVAFSPSHHYAAGGTVDGTLTVWDMSSQTVRYQFKHKEGIVKLCWDPVEPIVHSCSLDGCVYTWDVGSGVQLSKQQGHTAYILDIDMSRDGSLILTASDDGTARVFRVHKTS